MFYISFSIDTAACCKTAALLCFLAHMASLSWRNRFLHCHCDIGLTSRMIKFLFICLFYNLNGILIQGLTVTLNFFVMMLDMKPFIQPCMLFKSMMPILSFWIADLT